MNIGQAATCSGVSAKMIRFYEQIGLIPKVIRSDAGYRHYSLPDVHSLRFIRRARDLGFSIEQISALLVLWRDRHCASADVKAMALSHVGGLKVKIAELQTMAQTLEHLADHCHGDDRPECPILGDLAKPMDKEEQRSAAPHGKPRFGTYTPASARRRAVTLPHA